MTISRFKINKIINYNKTILDHYKTKDYQNIITDMKLHSSETDNQIQIHEGIISMYS